jgi:hypothetical protein
MSKKKRQSATAPDPFAEMLDDLFGALAAGDVLQAEIEAARCWSVPYRLGIDEDNAAGIFIGMAKQGRRPEDAALLRLITLTGSASVKSQARAALGELTAAGVYPASWVAEVGKAEPVRASRVYDVYGDREEIRVTFRYASGEHTLIAGVVLAGLPRVSRLRLTDGEPAPSDLGPHEQAEELSLADVRAHVESALREAEDAGWLDGESSAVLPIVRSRLRRLPASEPESAPPLTGEDRAALVREFLASEHAKQAVAADEASTRFWAEILTGWTSLSRSRPPLQAGPYTLRIVLNDHAPYTYPVTAEQREHMEQAVTAWARWSAARRGLDEEHMLDMLPATISSSAFLYATEDAAERRAYLDDVATSDADIAELFAVYDARAIAMPPSEEREDDDLAALDAADPEDRARYLAADFADCKPPGDLPYEEFLGVVRQVAEELWGGEPASTRERALALLHEDELDRHEIMHALVRDELTHRPPGRGRPQ